MKNKLTKIISVILIVILLLSLFTSCSKNSVLPKYSLEIDFDSEKMSISCVEKVQYINLTGVVLDKICFNMFGNAYRNESKFKPVSEERVYAAYPKGKNYGYIDIEKVLINNDKANFSVGGVDCNFLTINLTEPLNQNEKIDIEITFTEKLANVRHRLGYTSQAVSLGNFFPILAVYENGGFVECPYYNKGDPFYSEVANYLVEIKYPSEYSVATSGQCTNINNSGAFTTMNASANKVRDFAITLSKDYKIMTGKVGKTEVSYFYYNDENPEVSFLAAQEAVLTFNKLFGEYPYPTLNVCETGFIHGGMEYPGIVFISDTLTKEQHIEVIAHEIAHQWWYGVVGVDEIKNAYIDEGLAQYSTLLFFEYNEKYNLSREDIISSAKKSYDTFKDIYNFTGKKLLEKIDRPLSEFNTEFEYTYLTYVLTQLVLDEARNLCSDEDFFRALKTLYKDYAYANIGKEEFLQVFKDVCDIDVSGFILSYLDGKIIQTK